mgnify:CR=1 FL=1
MILIADAGATKTDWRLVTSDFHPLKKITSGINLSVNRTDKDLSDVYRAMASELDVPFGEVSVLWYYGAGFSLYAPGDGTIQIWFYTGGTI